MSEKKYYPAIDIFRIIASVLVIAIHTSPLAGISQNADFALTRIIARIAVPFFFTASGFFAVSRYGGYGRIFSFCKRIAVIYIIAIALYLPLNIYNEYFITNDLRGVLRDVVFDGTFYHLWYLPASIIGAVIAAVLIKKTDNKTALIAASLLYVIGLLGDSYYGAHEGIPALRGFYNSLFGLFGYTRNGLFFAPLFFVLGGIFADKKRELSLKANIAGLAASLAVMLLEGFALRGLGFQRHDSMYIALPFLAFFLFGILKSSKGKAYKRLRPVSLIVYIIHPWIIVIIRLFAKLTGTEALFIQNDLAHFALVCTLSFAAAILLCVIAGKAKKQQKPVKLCKPRAELQINYDNLLHNVNELSAIMPDGCKLMAVVKADAYGHGGGKTAEFLERNGVDAFAVAAIDEGIALRKYGIKGEILILGYTPASRARELKKYRLTQTIISTLYAKELDSAGVKLNVHIKINTGMNRLGINAEKREEILSLFSLKNLRIRGTFTHLCRSDKITNEDAEFTRGQIRRFYTLISFLTENGADPGKIHIQSSYGLLNYPELKCDYVRPGIALYGSLSSSNSDTVIKPGLRPVLTLKSVVAVLRDISRGDNIGYGNVPAPRDMRIAVIPIGYADGVPRAYGGKVYIKSSGYADVVGHVCMDCLIADVSGLSGVREGDDVTIIGSEIPAVKFAEDNGTIANEVFSRIGERAKNFYS